MASATLDKLATKASKIIGLPYDACIQKLTKANEHLEEETIEALVGILNPSKRLKDKEKYFDDMIKKQIRATKMQNPANRWDRTPIIIPRESTWRDLEILELLYKYRYLDSKQIALLIGASEAVARMALLRLWEANLIIRTRRSVKVRLDDQKSHLRIPTIYTLTKDGFRELEINEVVDAGEYDENLVMSSFKVNIAHELEVNRVCLGIVNSAKSRGVRAEWISSKEVYHKFGGKILGADAGIEFDDAFFFVEVEREWKRKKFEARFRRWKSLMNDTKMSWQQISHKRPWLLTVAPYSHSYYNTGHSVRLTNIIEVAKEVQTSRLVFLATDYIESDVWEIEGVELNEEQRTSVRSRGFWDFVRQGGW